MTARNAPYWSDDQVSLYLGDCLDVLAEMADASVDAVVTDPPYGLEFMGREWDSFKPPSAARIRTRVDGRTNPADGKSVTTTPESYSAGRPFQDWCQAWAAECLRVLKPGGHLLAFGGTRTYHRLACAVEDAGFEVRDSMHWIYGSGFPKSLDVSKAIDKRRDDEADVRTVCRWLRDRIGGHPAETVKTIAARFGFHSRMVEHWAARDSDSQPTLPTLEQWDALRDVLGFGSEMDAEVLRLNLRKGEPGEAWADRPITGHVIEWQNRTAYALTSRDGLRRDQATTDDAARWHGWGTALKPSHEPIVVARKPLAGTVAQNVLEHGTGALNIDGCRVEGGLRPARSNAASASGLTGTGGAATYGSFAVRGSIATGETDAGRWPPNVVLGPEAAAELDRQSGVLTSGANPERRGSDKFRDAYGEFAGQTECTPARGADSGGASRFFPVFRYEAKAGAAERPRGEDGTAHPTVKPVDLMAWLVRLVTPPGGIVLDPFAGSGTTAEACIVESFRCVLVEKDPAYAELIRKRLRKDIQPTMFGLEAS